MLRNPHLYLIFKSSLLVFIHSTLIFITITDTNSFFYWKIITVYIQHATYNSWVTAITAI
jgi:hypothetical protein